MAELVLEKLTVKSTRVVCDVRVEGPWQTTPQLISALLVRYPTLLHHACVNDEGETFAAVADHTSLPHLLEHLVIAMQVEAEEKAQCGTGTGAGMPASKVVHTTSGATSEEVGAGTPAAAQNTQSLSVPGSSLRPSLTPTTFLGTTEWADRAAGQARVEVNFRDDLIALRAFSEATAFLNRLLGESDR